MIVPIVNKIRTSESGDPREIAWSLLLVVINLPLQIGAALGFVNSSAADVVDTFGGTSLLAS